VEFYVHFAGAASYPASCPSAASSSSWAGIFPASDAAPCILAALLLPASRCASDGGARHTFLPVRNGHDGHVIATQTRTSCALPAQQSRHFARIASIGDIGLCPIASSSARAISRGSRGRYVEGDAHDRLDRRVGFRQTPGPVLASPAFRNLTPASSIARSIAFSVDARGSVRPPSAPFIANAERPAAFARSTCFHPSNARAARI